MLTLVSFVPTVVTTVVPKQSAPDMTMGSLKLGLPLQQDLIKQHDNSKFLHYY